jgi:hypothetical protein
MAKNFKAIIATLAIIFLCAMAYNYFAFADERKIRRALHEMREKISAPITGGLDTALMAAGLKPFFAPEINIYLRHGGGEVRQIFGQDELLRILVVIKQHNPKLTVNLDFSRKNIQVIKGRTATVSAWVTVENFDEPFEPRRMTFTFGKNEDKRWQLTAVGEDDAG